MITDKSFLTSPILTIFQDTSTGQESEEKMDKDEVKHVTSQGKKKRSKIQSTSCDHLSL